MTGLTGFTRWGADFRQEGLEGEEAEGFGGCWAGLGEGGGVRSAIQDERRKCTIPVSVLFMRILRPSPHSCPHGEEFKIKTALSVVACGLFFARLLCADSTEAPPPKEEGVIILNEIPAQSASANISFATIQWVDYGSGFVTDANGTKISFLNHTVRAIIYYDPDYYAQMDQMRDSTLFGQGIETKEIVTNLDSTRLTSDDLKTIQGQIEALKFTLEVNESADAIITPKIAILSDDVNHLSNKQQLLNGKWVPQDAILPPVEIVGKYVQTVTIVKDDGESNTVVIVDGQQYSKASANDKQYSKRGYPLTLTQIAKIVDDNNGSAVILNEGTDIPFVDFDLTGLPNEVIRRLAEARLVALISYTQYGSAEHEPVSIGNPPPILKSNGSDNNFITVFITEAEVLGRESTGIPSVQNELPEIVVSVLQKNLPDPNNISFIWKEWPKLKVAMAFTSQQQIDFYTLIIQQKDLSLDGCKAILTMVNATDSPSDVKNAFATLTNQVSKADLLNSQMEQALVAFFSDQANLVVLQKTETQEQLAQPLNFGSNGDAACQALEGQLSQTDMPCIKSLLQAYQNSWLQIKAISELRSFLASGKLSEAESLASTLNSDRSTTNVVTPGQQLVLQANAANVSLYEAQKAEAQRLLDDAERLKALGGQNSKALQDYKDAYKLNSDPAILQSIKDLNNESLGI